MNFTQTVLTIFEVILVAFALWAVFNEDKFIVLEDKIKVSIRRRRLRVVKQSRVVRTTHPTYNS